MVGNALSGRRFFFLKTSVVLEEMVEAFGGARPVLDFQTGIVRIKPLLTKLPEATIEREESDVEEKKAKLLITYFFYS
jgi:hypothetical protein